MKINIHNIYRPFLRFFRARRMRVFQEKFNVSAKDKIIDVGGTPYNWSLISEKPELFIVNLSVPQQIDVQKTRWVVADGRSLPFKKEAFDIAYSNSVIEHLSSFENQLVFASEFKRVAKKYYLQTPNRKFFFEPHYLTPFIHWLPTTLQKKLMRNFTVRGLITRPNSAQCNHFVEEINLLTRKELFFLFPEAEVWPERFFIWVKSFVIAKR